LQRRAIVPLRSGIAFTYGARTVHFADNIDESEAADVIRQIRQYCPVDAAPSAQASAKSPGAA
jgi:hypothetical protein